jgi:hypothetical protein
MKYHFRKQVLHSNRENNIRFEFKYVHRALNLSWPGREVVPEILDYMKDAELIKKDSASKVRINHNVEAYFHNFEYLEVTQTLQIHKWPTWMKSNKT